MDVNSCWYCLNKEMDKESEKFIRRYYRHKEGCSMRYNGEQEPGALANARVFYVQDGRYNVKSQKEFCHIKNNSVALVAWMICLWLMSSICYAQAPDLFLLKTYQKQKDVTGWVMSEKLDGVRAYWDGHQLLSRNGHVFKAPKWFIQDFPPFALDGELWTKRSDFEHIVSIVRQQQPDERWSEIRYMVFEVPLQKGGFLERLAILRNYLQAVDQESAQSGSTEARPEYLSLITQVEVKNQAHLQGFLERVVAQGGEGVVVRDPATPYQTGRLKSALKVKLFQDDECEVIGYKAGKGKYLDSLGALKCRLGNQNVIHIGSGLSDELRRRPPAIGSVITFKFYGLTKKGLPRFPVFLRVRMLEMDG